MGSFAAAPPERRGHLPVRLTHRLFRVAIARAAAERLTKTDQHNEQPNRPDKTMQAPKRKPDLILRIEADLVRAAYIRRDEAQREVEDVLS